MDREVEFTEFASARWLALVRSARLLGCSVHEAEDVAQATLVRCYLSWPRVSGAANLDAYAARVLLNVHRQSRRRLWWRERPTEHLPETTGIDPIDGLADVETIRRVLGRLAKAQLEVVVLRHYLGLSEQETAASLGIPPGTVKSRLSRAMTQLAAREELRGILDGRAA